MRFDKLTTKFQRAFAEAQSIALGLDATQIEPQHLLMACLSRKTAAPSRCCSAPASTRPSSNATRPPSSAAAPAGRRRQHINWSRPQWTAQPDGQGSHQAWRPVHRQRAVSACAGRRQGETGRIFKDAGAPPKTLSRHHPPCAATAALTRRRPKASASRWKILHRPHGACPLRQADR